MFSVRRLVSIVALTAVLFASLSAQTPQPGPTQPAQPQQQKSQPKCTDNGTYVNSKGETVKRPESCSAAPQGATAQCRDGSYSFSQSRRGTCSHHGGVSKWL
jgi:resuscitation-promoting factor RpfB